MDLLVCDAEINNHYEVANGNIDLIMNMKVGGGGGTSVGTEWRIRISK
jgi:hypothetical protein